MRVKDRTTGSKKRTTVVAKTAGTATKKTATKKKTVATKTPSDAEVAAATQLVKPSEGKPTQTKGKTGARAIDVLSASKKVQPKKLKLDGYKGWAPLEGLTNLGLRVTVTPTAKKKDKFHGIVVADRQGDGLLVARDDTGEVVQVKPNTYSKKQDFDVRGHPTVRFTEVGGPYVARGLATAMDLMTAMQKMKAPAGIVQIATEDLWAHDPQPSIFLFGEIDFTVKKGRRMVRVTDPNGVEHTFSAMHTPFRAYLFEAEDIASATPLAKLNPDPVNITKVKGWNLSEYQEKVGGLILPEKVDTAEKPPLSAKEKKRILNLPKGAKIAADLLSKFDSRSVAEALVERAHKKNKANDKGTFDWGAQSELRNHFPEHVLPFILEFGFLNQHQTIASTGGDEDLPMRNKVENAMLGVRLGGGATLGPESDAAAMAPKYAHLYVDAPDMDINTANNADTYGDVIAVFDEEVKQRTLWAPGDTKVAYEEGEPFPTRTLRGKAPPVTGKSSGLYYEGLIYGKLDLGDVKEWLVKPDVSKDTIKRLKATGKPVYSTKMGKGSKGRIRDKLL